MEPSCFGSGNAALEQPAEKGRASIDLATTFGIVFGVLGALLLRRAYRSINVIPPYFSIYPVKLHPDSTLLRVAPLMGCVALRYET